jgi:hypothetical protein
MHFERRATTESRSKSSSRSVTATLIGAAALIAMGCSSEPSQRELQNARAFEALLTAVCLRNQPELEKDAQEIENRHVARELSDEKYQDLSAMIQKARAGNWQEAEAMAYQFRQQFGDHGSYFK